MQLNNGCQKSELNCDSKNLFFYWQNYQSDNIDETNLNFYMIIHTMLQGTNFSF